MSIAAPRSIGIDLPLAEMALQQAEASIMIPGHKLADTTLDFIIKSIEPHWCVPREVTTSSSVIEVWTEPAPHKEHGSWRSWPGWLMYMV